MVGRGLEFKFKALIVWLILNGRAEEALEQLAQHYNVDVPKLRVGLPKAHKKKTSGCYTTRNETISIFDSDTLKEPFVILHEFYHHLRTAPDKKHRGTEKHADKFAKEFIEAYRSITRCTSGDN